LGVSFLATNHRKHDRNHQQESTDKFHGLLLAKIGIVEGAAGCASFWATTAGFLLPKIPNFLLLTL
jgi:hypothetical protein